MITKDLNENDNSIWLGMSDYRLILKQSNHEILMKYIGEPPHGDSYHQIELNGKLLKGYYWGCMFLFPSMQRYMVASWMEKLFERKTIIVDFKLKLYTVLDKYWYDFKEIDDKIVLINKATEEVETINLTKINDWLDL